MTGGCHTPASRLNSVQLAVSQVANHTFVCHEFAGHSDTCSPRGSWSLAGTCLNSLVNQDSMPEPLQPLFLISSEGSLQIFLIARPVPLVQSAKTE